MQFWQTEPLAESGTVRCRGVVAVDPGSGAQGPHQSKRTDAERRERVVDPGSGPKVRISPNELMRREERELSTQNLGPRSESSVSTGSDKIENVQPGSLHLLDLCLHTSGLDLFISTQSALSSSLFVPGLGFCKTPS